MRARGYKSKTRKNINLFSFVSLCVTLILWYTLPRYLYRVNDIQIIGSSHISKETALESLEQLRNAPLFHINSNYVVSLLQNGWVKSVDVYELPPNELILKINERTPFLIIEPQNGNPLLIDDEGYVIENPTQARDLPILLTATAEIGENGSLTLPILEDLKELFERLKETPIEIDKLELSPTGELSFFTKGGVQIIIGEPKELFQKIFVLKALWGKIPNIERRLSYINLSCPSKPAIMERENQ